MGLPNASALGALLRLTALPAHCFVHSIFFHFTCKNDAPNTARPPTSTTHTYIQDDEGGLEVQRRSDGEWVPALSRRRDLMTAGNGNESYPLTCIVGDMLQRWTNDVFRSTPHRVVSIAFFLLPGV